MKMYILVKDDVPLGFAMTAVAHAVAAAFLKWHEWDSFKKWHRESFRKVVCQVSKKEFENAQEIDDNIVMTESAFNGGASTAIVFKPRPDGDWPKAAKFWKLYK